jgi:glycosyltransferase involved in cell wall biosynthesis
MHKITGTIITLNAEKYVLRAIESLKQICDEIIVLDSESTDTTRDIASSAGAKVFTQPFLGDGGQKKEASKFSKNDWIFSLDADEYLDSDLIDFINKINLDDRSYDSYSFRRKNFCGDEWIKAAGFYPDSVTRLYNKSFVNYDTRADHAAVNSSKTYKTKVHIIHNTYNSMEEWVNKMNFRSSMSAQQLFKDGKMPSLIRPIVRSLFAFFKKLIVKGGLFQGSNGFRVALTTMFNTYLKYTKLNELHKKKDSSNK